MRAIKFFLALLFAFLGSFVWRSPEFSQKLCFLACKILGLELRFSRAIPENCTVFANHQGWLDILVIGSLNPYRFIAKSEIKNLLFVNWIARNLQTLFVTRGISIEKQPKLKEQIAISNFPIVCFPEGTTNKSIGKLKLGLLNFVEQETPLPAIALHMKFTPQNPILYLRGESLFQNLKKLFGYKGKILVEIDWIHLDRNKGKFSEQALFFFKTMEQSSIDF